MKRRLDIGLGLIHRPRVLFLDEPTTGLDPEARAAMWDELERLAQMESLTVLLTTHYLEEADKLADRLAIVSRGRIVAEGTPEGLKQALKGDSVTAELEDGRAAEGAEAVRAVAGVLDVSADGQVLRARVENGGRAVPGIMQALEAREHRGRLGDALTALARRRLPPLHGPRLQGRRHARGGGVTAVAHTWYMLGRQTRNLIRQPVWIFILLIQPFFWLLLYSQLFQRITELPGFGTSSYIQFLVPGIVVMTAFFSATWSGMAMIEDLRLGVVERFLATPARRSALVLSQVVRSGLQSVIQAVIILGIGFLMGARVSGGVAGWLVIFLAAFLVSATFAGISHGLALLTRKDATMIAVSNFIGLPLLFISTALIAEELMPDWMQWAAKFNPVQWGIVSAREVMLPGTDWASAWAHLGLLLASAIATTAFATWAFRAYRRTL